MFRLKGVLLRECVLILLKMATEEKKHLQANTQYILTSLPLYRPNGRTILCRSRVRQTTQVNTLHLWSTVCKLSPFHCICSNMFSYSDASCQETFLGHPATSQAKYSSTPKMSRSLFLKGMFLRAVAFTTFSSMSETIIVAHVKRRMGNSFF